jgi:hypothetical protein
MKMDINKDGGGAYNENDPRLYKLLSRFLKDTSKYEGYTIVIT